MLAALVMMPVRASATSRSSVSSGRTSASESRDAAAVNASRGLAVKETPWACAQITHQGGDIGAAAQGGGANVEMVDAIGRSGEVHGRLLRLESIADFGDSRHTKGPVGRATGPARFSEGAETSPARPSRAFGADG